MSRFRNLTPKIVDYKTSKTNPSILTVRHGFNLLQRDKELEYIRKKVINEKAHSDLDGDFLVDDFNNFLEAIAPLSIVEKITTALERINAPTEFKDDIGEIIQGLSIYINGFDDCVNDLRGLAKEVKLEKQLDAILEEIRLYRVDQPFVALASNYGVPQTGKEFCSLDVVRIKNLLKRYQHR